MWSIGSIRIKHNENVFTSDPYDKDFYNMYDGEYIRVGDLYVTKDLPSTFDYDSIEFSNFCKECYISMGPPYKSSNSEVLDRAIELFYFVNYDHTGVKMNLHKKDITSLFNMESLHIVPRFNEKQVIKVWSELSDKVKIQILTTMVTMTHKNNLYRHIYERLKIRDIDQGLLVGSHVVKVLPIKYDSEVNLEDYRDVFFNKVLYPTNDDSLFVYPSIKKMNVVSGISSRFYSKYNMSIYSAKTNSALVIIMNKLPFSLFIFIRDILYMHYSEKIHFTEINNLIYKSLQALLYIHRNGMYHGDFHAGNLVIGEKHELYKLPEFKEGMILANKYTINPIDFGESFLFTEHSFIMPLIKKNLSEIYTRYIEEIKNKYNRHRDEFIVACTCLDVIEILTSLRDTIKYVMEFHNLEKSDHQRNIFKRLKEMINWIVSKFTEYLKSSKSIYEIFTDDQIVGGIPAFVSNKKVEYEKSVMYAGNYSRLPVYLCIKYFFPANFNL